MTPSASEEAGSTAAPRFPHARLMLAQALYVCVVISCENPQRFQESSGTIALFSTVALRFRDIELQKLSNCVLLPRA